MWMGSLSGRPSTTPTIKAMVTLINIFSATKNTTRAQCFINSLCLFPRHDPVESPHSQPSPLLLTPLRWSASATSTRSPIPLLLRCALLCVAMSASTTNIVARSSIPALVGTFLMFWWKVQQSTITLNAIFYSSPPLWCLGVVQRSTRSSSVAACALLKQVWQCNMNNASLLLIRYINKPPSLFTQCSLSKNLNSSLVRLRKVLKQEHSGPLEHMQMQRAIIKENIPRFT